MEEIIMNFNFNELLKNKAENNTEIQVLKEACPEADAPAYRRLVVGEKYTILAAKFIHLNEKKTKEDKEFFTYEFLFAVETNGEQTILSHTLTAFELSNLSSWYGKEFNKTLGGLSVLQELNNGTIQAIPCYGIYKKLADGSLSEYATIKFGTMPKVENEADEEDAE